MKLTCPHCGIQFDLSDRAAVEQHQSEVRGTPTGRVSDMHAEILVHPSQLRVPSSR